MQDSGSDNQAPENSSASKRAIPSVLKSAAMMSLGTLCSRILGLVRDLVLAALFPRTVTDAFSAAFKLPNLFRRLLGEGSLSASFIPVFVDAITVKPGEDPEAVKKRGELLANAVFTWLAIITSGLSVLGVLFMPQIMGLLVGSESYTAVEGKLELTSLMGRVMFSYLFLVTTYAYLMGIMNAYGRFFLAALAPAGFNATLIVFNFLPGFQIYGDQLAWGVLAGGVVQLLLVAIPLRNMGKMPRLTAKLMTAGVSLVFKNMLPSMVGMGVLQILTLMNVYFASQLEEGALTYIYLADRLLELPQSLISVSLGVALLPTLSRLWSEGRVEDMKKEAHKNIRLLLTLALPSSLGLYLLSIPIIQVLFMRLEFSYEDAIATASVLQIYSFLLITTSIHRVLVPNFYAKKDTRTPMLVSAVAVFTHYYVASYGVEHHGLTGLISATVFTGTLSLGLLYMAYCFNFGSLGLRKISLSVLKLIFPLLAMALFASFGYTFLEAIFINIFGSISFGSGLLGAEFFPRLLSLGLTIPICVAIYFGVGILTRHEDITEALSLIKRRRNTNLRR